MSEEKETEVVNRTEIVIKKERRKLSVTELIILIFSALVIGTGVGFVLVYFVFR